MLVIWQMLILGGSVLSLLLAKPTAVVPLPNRPIDSPGAWQFPCVYKYLVYQIIIWIEKSKSKYRP